MSTHLPRRRIITAGVTMVAAAALTTGVAAGPSAAAGFGSSDLGTPRSGPGTADLTITFADLDVDAKTGVRTTGVFVTNLWGPAVAKNVTLTINNGQAKSAPSVGINSGFQIEVTTRGPALICARATSSTPDSNPINNQSCKTIISFVSPF